MKKKNTTQQKNKTKGITFKTEYEWTNKFKFKKKQKQKMGK